MTATEEPNYDDLIAEAHAGAAAAAEATPAGTDVEHQDAASAESGDRMEMSDRFVIEDLPEDHSEREHDQLPSVEEAKANLAMDKGGCRSRKKLLMVLLLSLVVIGALVGIIVGISKSSKNKKNPEIELTSRRKEVIDFLFAERVTVLPNMEDLHLPQAKAAMFMADGDALQLSYDTPESARRFIERYALAVMFYHFNGDKWNYHLNFLTAQDHCKWYGTFETVSSKKTIIMGVVCNAQGHVIKLNLSQNGLVGKGVPDEIKNIVDLESIHLYFNSIGGGFPEAFREMTNLKSIAMMDSGLQGPIPAWLGNHGKLSTLALGNNQFHGEVPDSISNLRNLKILGLDDNDGLTGNINQLFSGMRNLEALYLEDNAFSGQLPGNDAWPALIELDISNNMIDEEIPKSFFNKQHMVVLDAHKNMLYGDFPSDIFANTKLEVLALQHNQLQGSVPDRLPFLQSLKHLDLSFNNLVGTLPDNIGEMSTIRYFSTSANKFDAQPIPNMERMTSLMDFAMKSNNLVGKFPEWISTMSHLRLLDLDANQISGMIPTWIGMATNLQHVLLNRNQLSGVLPPQLANLKKLDVLLIDSNNIHGGAHHICDANDVHPTYFTADCYPGRNGEKPEIDCRCCSTCCIDDDPTCNNFAWTSDLDPVWEYGYLRKSYVFSLSNAPADYSKDGDAAPSDPIDDFNSNSRRFLTGEQEQDSDLRPSVLSQELGMH